MKLHLDKAAFESLILNIAEQTNIRADVVEKDYYVTLLLKELAKMQKDLLAYFKGGTALYKALGGIRRFSEDIDLTVSIEGCTNTAAKRRLEKAAVNYTSLVRNKDDADNDNRKGSITTIYNYTSVVDVDTNDSLQRFGRVKIEATSFTVSEPFAPITIAPLIYEKATPTQQEILVSAYKVSPFEVQTIKLERIFIDKVFAAEFYYLREQYFDVAKHLYDITVLLQDKRIEALLKDKSMLNQMIALKRKEERHRLGSGLAEKEIKEFVYLQDILTNLDFLNEFGRMQEIYVFNSDEIISIDELAEAIEELKIVAQIE